MCVQPGQTRINMRRGLDGNAWGWTRDHFVEPPGQGTKHTENGGWAHRPRDTKQLGTVHRCNTHHNAKSAIDNRTPLNRIIALPMVAPEEYCRRATKVWFCPSASSLPLSPSWERLVYPSFVKQNLPSSFSPLLPSLSNLSG